MEDKRKIAFAEVYDIIKHSDISIQKRISPTFMNIIENNMDKSYKVMIDYNKELEEPNILHETKIILGIIYRDYLCDAEKKKQLIKSENELLQKIEKERQDKYSVDNLFKNTKYAQTGNINNTVEENRNMDIAVYQKEKWYIKFWNSIMKIFKK